MISQPSSTLEPTPTPKVRSLRTRCSRSRNRWIASLGMLVTCFSGSVGVAQQLPYQVQGQTAFPVMPSNPNQPQTFSPPVSSFNPAQAGNGNQFDPYASPQAVNQPVYGTQQTYAAPQPYTVQQQVGAPGNGLIGPEPVQGVPFNAQPMAPQVTPLGEPLPPLNSPWSLNTDAANTSGLYQPRVRDVPIDIYLQEAQTGRFILGGTVNTDLGVAGQVIVEERNFDITNFPRRGGDLFNGAFRGGGQNFRLEAVPGNQVQRYSVDWTEPNLFGYSPYSLSVGGFFFNRIYRDYDEERLGGRVSVGYVVTPDLQVSSEIRLENVEIANPRIGGVSILDNALGNSDVYTGRVRLTHNTRDSPFLPTEGHFFEAIYDQVFGEFDFPRIQLNFSRYYLVRERADGGGRHTFTIAHRLGFSGEDTPIFENFFAGGFSTLRGFRFRGASPTENDVQVGGRFQYLGSMEYMMPLTADDMLRLVTFVDYGIIERDIDFNWDNFRVAPGLGLRVAVPAMGPAPLAFDFAFPINEADGDQTQVFSFNVGVTR